MPSIHTMKQIPLMYWKNHITPLTSAHLFQYLLLLFSSIRLQVDSQSCFSFARRDSHVQMGIVDTSTELLYGDPLLCQQIVTHDPSISFFHADIVKFPFTNDIILAGEHVFFFKTQ